MLTLLTYNGHSTKTENSPAEASSRPSVIGRTGSPHTQQIGILFSFRNSFIVNLLTMGNTQTGHSDRCAPVNYTGCGVTVSPDWMIKFMF